MTGTSKDAVASLLSTNAATTTPLASHIDAIIYIYGIDFTGGDGGNLSLATATPGSRVGLGGGVMAECGLRFHHFPTLLTRSSRRVL